VIASGTGTGPTSLAAFDAALLNAGIANYNLIYLSSIIPPGSRIERANFVTPPEEYGHRLYVVMAHHVEHQPEKMAWAGVGWTQNEDDGRGLFVELDGGSKADVAEAIQATLTAMMANRPYASGPIHSQVIGIECQTKPVCALVAAVYRSEDWGIDQNGN
jgi:arginine decarboxylase